MVARPSYRVQGLVLRRTKLGETDLIVTLLPAQQSEQVRVIAKGARKPAARLAGVVGLGNEVDLLVREGHGLGIVGEGRLLCSRVDLCSSYERAMGMEAVLDVTCDLTSEGEHESRLYQLTCAALEAVARCRESLVPLVCAAHVLKAASMQGYRPVLDTCVSCGAPVVPENPSGEACFSFDDGGVLCDACRAPGSGARRPAWLLSWAAGLIRMRFSELLELPAADQEDRLGLDVLEFAREWVHRYPGVRPRALDYMLSNFSLA